MEGGEILFIIPERNTLEQRRLIINRPIRKRQILDEKLELILRNLVKFISTFPIVAPWGCYNYPRLRGTTIPPPLEISSTPLFLPPYFEKFINIMGRAC